jgi:hypothetical protein
MDTRAAEPFFEPLQLHLQPADLLEQISLLVLTLVLVSALFAHGEQLAGAVEQLPLPLAHTDWVVPEGALHAQPRWSGLQRSAGSSYGH